MPSSPPLVIVGAGLAGLVCAKELRARGVEDFVVLEAGADVGGRVCSWTTPDGFVLDRGFQVLLDSYPAARRHLDFAALNLRAWDSGAVLAEAGRTWTLSDPRRHPREAWRTTTAAWEALGPGDALRLGRLVGEVMAQPDSTLLAEAASLSDVSAAGFLLARGFSPRVTERFLRPFFGGVLLEDRLATSVGLFRYYLKKFATGRAVLPARGMGEITKQLARHTPGQRFSFRTRVTGIVEEQGRAGALTLADGDRFACRAVLLATDEQATRAITGDTSPASPTVGVTTVYFQGRSPITPEKKIVLPAGRRVLARTLAPVTNAAPEYALPGRHLLAAQVLDRRGMDDAALADAVRAEIAALLPKESMASVAGLEPIAVVEVPDALRYQPAGFLRSIDPAPAPTRWPNVWRAGDQTGPSCINAAMESGEAAAAFLALLPRA